MRMLKQFAGKIREINTKYARPKVEMSKSVAFSLAVLRIYLFFLVLLMLYKLLTVIGVI
jgi:hypothetical protein